MTERKGSFFAQWAPTYRDLGYWPRPIFPGTKACKLKDWQTPDPEVDPAALESWLSTFSNHGIGLLLGSPFPDGTVLGGLDIDHDRYVRVAGVLLGNPPSGRFGARGIMDFVRIRGQTRYREFKVDQGDGQTVKVGELLIAKRLAVIPPTIHPDTHEPYRWVGAPLHETAWSDLPIIEA